MTEAVVVSTARSPIGRAFKGSLTTVRPDDLACQMVTAALAKVPQLDPADAGDLILGCGLPGGDQGFNMARVVAVMLGFDHLPGTTVTRYCSSSLQTTRMAFHAIKAGEGDVFISAGVECVSRFAKGSSDSWPDTKNPVFAGAEARTGTRSGAGTPVEKVRPLRPAFRADGPGTAGNGGPLDDGAAAVVIMSDRKAAELGITPLARIVATGLSALSPEIMGLGPVGASLQALDRAGMTIDDIDLVEINEAFAAQVIPSYRELGIDIDKLNVNGGAIAVGHPFGMTGARITSTLLNSLQFHDKTFGLETMCVGGGQGMAMIVERLS